MSNKKKLEFFIKYHIKAIEVVFWNFVDIENVQKDPKNVFQNFFPSF